MPPPPATIRSWILGAHGHLGMESDDAAGDDFWQGRGVIRTTD
ncbi:hypothetical protein EDF24_1441 [Curtobacterium sp. PhB130]|nr:hypothetical protein [Curtobacterium sp. PhB130]ROS75868.1 hypothetical protein EDF24_1441 [Curtobacterium sp. PhB130]